MKHFLCVYLPHWPIDRLRRRQPELRHKSLVLVETSGNRQTILHVSPETPAEILPGMALTEARGRLAALIDLPATPDADRDALEALGRWLMQFSPYVSIYPPCSLFLDATGLERLFGGLVELRTRVADAFKRIRLSAAVTIAPTPGAAWTLAAYGREPFSIIAHSNLLSALRPLPIAALRIEPKTVSLLASLGVNTIDTLLQLPRNDLARRFGPSILLRIDQATGSAPEPLDYLSHRSSIEAGVEFEAAIESIEVIALAMQGLIRQVVQQLTVRGEGVRELRLAFSQPYAQPVEKAVQLTRPTRNASELLKLLNCMLENLQTSEGVIAINIRVTSVQRLDDEQRSLIEAEREQKAAELDHLIERLRVRLDQGVEWGQLLESNLPECTFRSTDAPVTSVVSSQRTCVDRMRPLRLLNQPQEIRVITQPSESSDGHPIAFTDRGESHKLEHTLGPERITGQWWNGRWKTREYFDVLDEIGRRYWIFRVAQNRRWFLHGIFE